MFFCCCFLCQTMCNNKNKHSGRVSCSANNVFMISVRKCCQFDYHWLRWFFSLFSQKWARFVSQQQLCLVSSRCQGPPRAPPSYLQFHNQAHHTTRLRHNKDKVTYCFASIYFTYTLFQTSVVYFNMTDDTSVSRRKHPHPPLLCTIYAYSPINYFTFIQYSGKLLSTTSASWIKSFTNTYRRNMLFVLIRYMSHVMTKPTKSLYAQRRLRSVWASAQSDQSLRCALNG